MYVIVCFIAYEQPTHPYDKYLDRNFGRFKFQVDLGIALMEEGIHADWKDPDDPTTKPSWMRHQKNFSCECRVCFFCKWEASKNPDNDDVSISSRSSDYRRRHIPQGHDRHRAFIGISKTCPMCYQRLKKLGLTSEEARKKRRRTDHGCRECGEGGLCICETCWPNFTHEPV